MAYNTCGECLKVDLNNKSRYDDKYYCREKCRYVSLSDGEANYCRSFSYNGGNKSTDGYTPSGCYITTIVVDILGYEDNCEVLQVLRNFRENYLKTNIEYLPLLFEYDIVGPLIAKYIKLEKNKYQLCLNLMKYFLLPCVHLIKEEKYKEAIEVYKNMVLHLKDNYDIVDITITIPDEYRLEDVGKGRIRQPKTSEN